MKKAIRTTLGATLCLCAGFSVATVSAAEPILGNWLTPNGTHKDLDKRRTYAGSAKVAGSSLSLTGCALKVFCRTQKWKRR